MFGTAKSSLGAFFLYAILHKNIVINAQELWVITLLHTQRPIQTQVDFVHSHYLHTLSFPECHLVQAKKCTVFHISITFSS